MPQIQHHLIEKNSGKILRLTLQDTVLILESGKDNTFKTQKKEFLDSTEALKIFYKKEWEALKSGYIVRNENAILGQAILHTFIGGVYTGALSFENSPHGIFVYKDVQENGKVIGYLNQINDFGEIIESFQLPQALALNIQYRKTNNSLLMDIDHFIYEFDIKNQRFTNLGNEKRDATSFVSVSQNICVFATFGKIYCVNHEDKVVYTQNYSYENIKGNIPFCGTLSSDGKLLAIHNKIGEIQIFDAQTGEIKNKIIADFEMVAQLEFIENTRILVMREQYGNWGIRYFDLTTNKEIHIFESIAKDVHTFCVNADQTKLVALQNGIAHVFNLTEKIHLHSFKVEHLLKKCEIKFIGEKLGVRTDYGCFSLYNV